MQSRVDQLVLETGRPMDKLLEDAMAAYVSELTQTRALLDSRYDDIKTGKVQLIDGEEAFAILTRKTAEQRNGLR